MDYKRQVNWFGGIDKQMSDGKTAEIAEFTEKYTKLMEPGEPGEPREPREPREPENLENLENPDRVLDACFLLISVVSAICVVIS